MIHELIPSRSPHSIWALNGMNDIYQLRSSDMEMELVHQVVLPDGERTKTVFERNEYMKKNQQQL